jgi:hypothetical protein
MKQLVFGIALLICFLVSILWIGIHPDAFSVPAVVLLFSLLFVPGIVLAYVGARRIRRFRLLGRAILAQFKETGRVVPAVIAEQTGYDEATVRNVIEVLKRLGALPPDADAG